MSTVVIALIEDNGRFPMLQRKDERWVFASGKVDPGETVEQALHREAREEMGLKINLGPNLGQKEYEGNNGSHVLNYYAASIVEGDLVIGEPDKFSQAIWATAQQVLHYKQGDLPNSVIQYIQRFIRASELSLDRG